MSSVYGIEENSPLNYLQYPHVIDGQPLDIVHDILEGFATDFPQKRLSYFMHLKTFESLDTRNGKCINKYFQLFSC